MIQLVYIMGSAKLVEQEPWSECELYVALLYFKREINRNEKESMTHAKLLE